MWLTHYFICSLIYFFFQNIRDYAEYVQHYPGRREEFFDKVHKLLRDCYAISANSASCSSFDSSADNEPSLSSYSQMPKKNVRRSVPRVLKKSLKKTHSSFAASDVNSILTKNSSV